MKWMRWDADNNCEIESYDVFGRYYLRWGGDPMTGSDIQRAISSDYSITASCRVSGETPGRGVIPLEYLSKTEHIVCADNKGNYKVMFFSEEDAVYTKAFG